MQRDHSTAVEAVATVLRERRLERLKVIMSGDVGRRDSEAEMIGDARAAITAYLAALEEAGMVVVPKTAFDDPSHDEYRTVMQAVAKIAEGRPIPRELVPLTFMMCFMEVRRAMLSGAGTTGAGE